MLAAAGAAGCASFWLLHPGIAESNDPHLEPAQSGYPFQRVVVTNASGHRLLGWLIAEPGDHGIVLVAGGNAQSLSSTWSVSEYLAGHGFRMLVFSYQGFGGNGGRPDLESLSGDAEAFYKFSRSVAGDEPIGFVGYSTGAVVGICLSDREPLAAIVAEGSFNPKTIISDKHLWIAAPFRTMFEKGVPDELDTARCVQASRAGAIMFVHGPGDPLAPYDAARKLYDSFGGDKQFVETRPAAGADAHFGSSTDLQARQRILDFLEVRIARSR